MSVSVVIPVYNSENYLARCIDSILNQRYVNYELLLVDDGSSDESGRICETYAKRDDRVTFFRKENGGVSDARNYGIKRASLKSDYICFIDSDDVVDSLYLEYLIMGIDNAQLSMCHFMDVYNQNVIEPHHNQLSVIKYQDIKKNQHFVELFKTGILNSPCNKLYRLDVIREFGLCFPKETVIAEDLLFNLAYLRHCSSVNEVENALYCYCHRNGSLVSRINSKAYDCYLSIRNEMIDFFGQQFKASIDQMIYRQFESISIKLLEQKRSREVEYYVSQPEFQEVLDNVRLMQWNDRLIHFLLVHKQIGLLMYYVNFLNRNGEKKN